MSKLNHRGNLPIRAMLVALFALAAITLAWSNHKTWAFDAPDEPAHFIKAVEIAKGQNQLIRRNGQIGYGFWKLDVGNPFTRTKEDAKILRNKLRRQSVEHVTTTGEGPSRSLSLFHSIVPNGNAAYLPQSASAWMSIRAKHNLWKGYKQARSASIAAYLSVIAYTLISIGRNKSFLPSLVLPILMMPMSLFLAASVSADAQIIAASGLSSILVGQEDAYTNTENQNRSLKALRVGAIIACIAILSSKSAYLPISIWLSWKTYQLVSRYSCESRKEYRALGKGVTALTLSAILTITVMRTAIISKDVIINLRLFSGAAKDPNPNNLVVFIQKLYASLMQDWDGIAKMTIGIGGWLNKPLPELSYTLIIVSYSCLLVCTAISLYSGQNVNRVFKDSERKVSSLDFSKIFLSIAILTSIGLIYYALYTSWSVASEPFIRGFQGRYYLPVLCYIPLLILPGRELYRQDPGQTECIHKASSITILSAFSLVLCAFYLLVYGSSIVKYYVL